MDHITSNLGETHPSGNLSVLPETSATTCFKGGKTNSPEELNTFLRSDGLRKMSQQLNTLLADAIVRFRLIPETMLWRSYDSLVKTARSRVRLHSFYAQKPVQIHQTYFPPSSLFGARIIRARANTSCSRDYNMSCAEMTSKVGVAHKISRALTRAVYLAPPYSQSWIRP